MCWVVRMSKIELWRADAPSDIEDQVRYRKRQLALLDDSIAVQQRLIAKDGESPAYNLSLMSMRRLEAVCRKDFERLLGFRANEVVKFALDGRPYDLHQAPVKALVAVLGLLQDLFTRVVQSRIEANPGRIVSPQISHMTQLRLADTYPSSFGVTLTLPSVQDLTGQTLVIDSLNDVFDLVNRGDVSRLQADMGMYSVRKYRELVKALQWAQALPKVTWLPPDGEQKSWQPDFEAFNALANRLAMVRDERVVVRSISGTMVGVSLLRRRFEFVGQDGQLHGRIPAALVQKVADAFNKKCSIKIEETTFIDEATEQQRSAFRLLDVVVS